MPAALMAWKVLEEQQPELAAFGAARLNGQVRVRGDLQTDLGHTSQRGDAGINAMFYRARYD